MKILVKFASRADVLSTKLKLRKQMEWTKYTAKSSRIFYGFHKFNKYWEGSCVVSAQKAKKALSRIIKDVIKI